MKIVSIAHNMMKAAAAQASFSGALRLSYYFQEAKKELFLESMQTFGQNPSMGNGYVNRFCVSMPMLI
jgi:hypothetical protein